jgi:hypothetical protein
MFRRLSTYYEHRHLLAILPGSQAQNIDHPQQVQAIACCMALPWIFRLPEGTQIGPGTGLTLAVEKLGP